MTSWLRRRGKQEAQAAPKPRPKKTYHGPVKGTLSERNQFIAGRWDAAQARDARRYELAREVGARKAFTIPRDSGFIVREPGTVPGVDEVVSAGNALIDEIGDEDLRTNRMKGGFRAEGFMRPEDYELDSVYLRFALSEDALAPIVDYLGVVPILTKIDLWYSVPGVGVGGEQPRASQLWHLDHDDRSQLKIFVHLNDVKPESGPLTALDAATSARLADEGGYDFGEHARMPDDIVERLVDEGSVVEFKGPAGTADFVDSSRCFHMGSRVEAHAEPRRLALFKYLTPYAFEFPDDPRGTGPFSHLAAQAPNDLARLVLGG